MTPTPTEGPKKPLPEPKTLGLAGHLGMLKTKLYVEDQFVSSSSPLPDFEHPSKPWPKVDVDTLDEIERATRVLEAIRGLRRTPHIPLPTPARRSTSTATPLTLRTPLAVLLTTIVIAGVNVASHLSGMPADELLDINLGAFSGITIFAAIRFILETK